MDDYGGGSFVGEIKNHIDSLIEANKDRVAVFFKGYQIAMRVLG
jgi:hypothetical protein